MMTACYKTLGVRATNLLVNKTIGSLFTSGESIQSLITDIQELEKNNIHALAGYAVEGLHRFDDAKIQEFYDFLIAAIHAQTEGKEDAHMALKITAFMSTDILTRMSRAQQVYMNDILQYDKKESITFEDLKNSLLERGIHFEEEDIASLFKSLKFSDNDGDTLSKLEIYANAHLLKLNKNSRTGLLRRIAIECGTGLNENDLKLFEQMSERINNVVKFAHERNCSLYVDAEQTYMQAAIESFGQQLTQKFNHGNKNTIMNGYQCYLKRMPEVIRNEALTAQKLGFNLSLKLVRGAYLREEGELAKQFGTESPCHDTLENTHESYNKCLKIAIENTTSTSKVLVATHNKDSIELAKSMILAQGINDYRVVFA